jgi:transposase
MNKNNQIVEMLSGAISATLSGNTTKATNLTAQALRMLAGSQSATNSTPRHKTGKTGAPSLLNKAQQMDLVQRVAHGQTIAYVAKHYGISYQTAYRYVAKARKSAVSA